MILLSFLVYFSVISFLFFGTTCLFTSAMRAEFVRYGVAKYRVLVGVLQLVGAIGLFLGYLFIVTIAIIAAIGLSLLMIMGFGIRLRIKDPFIQSFPSLFYAILNGIIAFMLCI